MNTTALYSTLGRLANEVLERVLLEIEEQSDISEEESIRLNKLCKILHGLEDLFVVEGAVRVFLPFPLLSRKEGEEAVADEVLETVLRRQGSQRVVQIRFPF